jgi:hypothetical protein
MTMSQKLSIIAGTISFVMVAILSALSLDMVEGEGFFMQGLFTIESSTPAMDADSPDMEGDSTRDPTTENPCR